MAARTLALLCVLLVFVTGCEPDTRPPASGAPNRVVVDDPRGELRRHERSIHAVLGSALGKAERVLPLRGVTVTVRADPGRAVEHRGVGGFAPDALTVWIYVDPAQAGRADFARNLEMTLAHEAHHAARWRGPGYGRTLFEAAITEGLADHFSRELLGRAWKPPPWIDAFAPEATGAMLKRAQAQLDDPAYDREAWFFGHGDLPRWTGYTLGYRVVAAHLAANPGTSAAQLVHAPATAFRPIVDGPSPAAWR